METAESVCVVDIGRNRIKGLGLVETVRVTEIRSWLRTALLVVTARLKTRLGPRINHELSRKIQNSLGVILTSTVLTKEH